MGNLGAAWPRISSFIISSDPELHCSRDSGLFALLDGLNCSSKFTFVLSGFSLRLELSESMYSLFGESFGVLILDSADVGLLLCASLEVSEESASITGLSSLIWLSDWLSSRFQDVLWWDRSCWFGLAMA